MDQGSLKFKLTLDASQFSAEADFAAKSWDRLKKSQAGFNAASGAMAFGTEQAAGFGGFTRALRPTAMALGFAANPQMTMAITSGAEALSGLTAAAKAVGVSLGAVGLAAAVVASTLAATTAAIQALNARYALLKAQSDERFAAGNSRAQMQRILDDRLQSGEITSEQWDSLTAGMYGKDPSPAAGRKRLAEVARRLRELNPGRDVTDQTDLANRLARESNEDPFAQRRADVMAQRDAYLTQFKEMARKAGRSAVNAQAAVDVWEDVQLNKIDAEEAKARAAQQGIGSGVGGVATGGVATGGGALGGTGLERMGFVFSSGGNPLMDYNRRTALATEKIAKNLESSRQTPASVVNN